MGVVYVGLAFIHSFNKLVGKLNGGKRAGEKEGKKES